MSLPQVGHRRFDSDAANDYHGQKFRMILPHWKMENSDGRKLLIVIDRPARADVASRYLLGNDEGGVVFRNVVDFVINKREENPAEILAVNYYDCRFDQSAESEQYHRNLFRKRLDEVVAAFEPDGIMLMGPNVVRDVYTTYLEKKAPLLDDPTKVIGRLLPIRYGGKRIPTIATLSLGTISNETANRPADFKTLPNLIGHFVQHFERLCIGKDLYTADPDFTYEVIRDREGFDQMYKRLLRAKHPCIDTETADLRRIGNTLVSIQMSFDGKHGYFLPWLHPESPFNDSDRRYMARKMAAWMEGTAESNCRYMVFANALFDLHQMWDTFKPNHCAHRIYDIQSAEFCFHPDTYVVTERGPIKVKDLVHMQDRPKVLSFNHSTGQTEYSEVVGAVERVNSDPLYEIAYEGGVLRVTGSHKIWSVTRNSYVMARDIRENEEVLVLPSPASSSSDDNS